MSIEPPAGFVAISGVSRGIGAELARAFLVAGWQVHGLGRLAATDLLNVPAFTMHYCDMAKSDSVVSACQFLPQVLDVLICNAASFGSLAFHSHEFSELDFADTLAINLIAPAIMARETRKRLLAGERKMIVMISTGNASLAGNVSGTMLAYRTSKTGLNQLVRCLAAEWAPVGITSLAVNPGWVRTRMGGEAAPLSAVAAGTDIFRFVTLLATTGMNGSFVNTDGTVLPW